MLCGFIESESGLLFYRQPRVHHVEYVEVSLFPGLVHYPGFLEQVFLEESTCDRTLSVENNFEVFPESTAVVVHYRDSITKRF